MRSNRLGVNLIAIYFGLFISAGHSYAQNTASMTSTTNLPPKTQKSWSLPLSYELDTTLHQEGSYERQVQQVFSIAPGYRFSSSWKLGSTVSVIKDDSVSGVGNTIFDNTSISLSYNRPLLTHLNWKTSAGGVIPTNQEQREQTTFQGAARLSTGLAIDSLVLQSSLSYTISFNRNFHEYNINADGKFNTRDSIGQTIGYDIPITSKISFSTSFFYQMAHNYADELSTRFSAGADLNWTPLKNLTLIVGTSNDGNALKPNGRDSNIEFFNDNTSIIKLGVNYIL